MILSAKIMEIPETVTLRDADERECLVSGMTGAVALKMSAERSDTFWSIYFDDELACVWGYAAESLFSYRCRAWLLSTDAVEWHKLTFARESIRALNYLLQRYEEVEVYVHKEYAAAMKWLSWLGFKPIAANENFVYMVVTRGTAIWVS